MSSTLSGISAETIGSTYVFTDPNPFGSELLGYAFMVNLETSTLGTKCIDDLVNLGLNKE